MNNPPNLFNGLGGFVMSGDFPGKDLRVPLPLEGVACDRQDFANSKIRA